MPIFSRASSWPSVVQVLSRRRDRGRAGEAHHEIIPVGWRRVTCSCRRLDFMRFPWLLRVPAHLLRELWRCFRAGGSGSEVFMSFGMYGIAGVPKFSRFVFKVISWKIVGVSWPYLGSQEMQSFKGYIQGFVGIIDGRSRTLASRSRRESNRCIIMLFRFGWTSIVSLKGPRS